MEILEFGDTNKRKKDFISFSKTAKGLENYCISRYGEKMYAVYGAF